MAFQRLPVLFFDSFISLFVMKKKIKLKIEVDVWGIEVEETISYPSGNGSGWYKFEYSIRTNGGKKHFGEVDGSWSSQTRLHFRQVLSRGYAARLVLEKVQ